MADQITSYFMLRVSDLSSDMALPRYPPPANCKRLFFSFVEDIVTACRFVGWLHAQASMTELAR